MPLERGGGLHGPFDFRGDEVRLLLQLGRACLPRHHGECKLPRYCFTRGDEPSS
jgi:hypothetical protein